MNSGQDSWFEAHNISIYETFLYIVAALLKTESYDTLHLILTNHYLLPRHPDRVYPEFDSIEAFHGYSTALQILAPEGRRLIAPAGELIKRQADRSDLPFETVMEAELLVLMIAYITANCHWFPQTLLYSRYSYDFPFFLRATVHRNFLKLAKVTGIEDVESLRQAVRAGEQRLQITAQEGFVMGTPLLERMNLDALDTL